MAQDRASGAEANDYGHDQAGRIAILLGTRLLSSTSNECVHNAERVVIKCARRSTTKIGITYGMLPRLDAAYGAFEDPDGSYRILRLPAQRCAELMEAEPKTSGRSPGREGRVRRSVFEQEGTRIAVVRI